MIRQSTYATGTMETANLLVLGSTMYWWVRGQGEKEEVILEDEAFQSP